MKEAEVFICSLCQSTFHSKTAIVRHMMCIHNNEPTIQKLERQRRRCKTSKQKNLGKKRVMIPNESLADLQPTEKKERVYCREYLCEVCSYKTVHLTTFKRHKLTHEKVGKKHQCPYCSFITVQSYNLERHLKDIHPFGPIEPIMLYKI